MTTFLMIFRRFPTTFRRFLKIFQNCSERQMNAPKHFPRISENSRRRPKIAEDYRGRDEDVSMIHQLFQVQFKRQTWYQQNHRYLHMWGYHIFTCEDIVSFLWICYHSVYHWLLYNKKQNLHLSWSFLLPIVKPAIRRSLPFFFAAGSTLLQFKVHRLGKPRYTLTERLLANLTDLRFLFGL